MSEERKTLALVAALVTVCFWASAFVGIRAAGHTFSPGALALGRLLIGTVLLGAFLLGRPTVRPSRRDWTLMLVTGVLWFGLYSVVLNEAEQRVDAGTAAMLVNIGPLIVLALAAVFLHERVTRSVLLGGAIAFAGVVVIGLASSSGTASLSGVILCLVAAVAYASGVVAQKPVLGRISALQVAWTCCAIGTVSCLVYAPALLRDLRAAPWSGAAWLMYLGVFPTSVAFTTWGYALARGTAGRIAATTYLVPPIAILMSWLMLDEVPTAVAVLGGALCLAGVYLARRS